MNTADWEINNNYIEAKSIGIIVDFADKICNNTIIVNSTSTATGIKFNMNTLINGTVISNNNITLVGVTSMGIDMSNAYNVINSIIIEGNNINTVSTENAAVGIYGGKDASNPICI